MKFLLYTEKILCSPTKPLKKSYTVQVGPTTELGSLYKKGLYVHVAVRPPLNLNQLPPSNAVRKQKIKYFKGCFQFGIVTIQKISPLWKSEIQVFRHFPDLKIAYFKGKKSFEFFLS